MTRETLSPYWTELRQSSWDRQQERTLKAELDGPWTEEDKAQWDRPLPTPTACHRCDRKAPDWEIQRWFGKEWCEEHLLRDSVETAQRAVDDPDAHLNAPHLKRATLFGSKRMLEAYLGKGAR